MRRMIYENKNRTPNLILTDYYHTEKCLTGRRMKLRIDCLKSTRSYKPFEETRNRLGYLFFSFRNVINFRGAIDWKTDMAIYKPNIFSDICVPDITKPFGVGYVKGTRDALLFVLSKDCNSIDIFVARGEKNNREELLKLLKNGELNKEMSKLRRGAIVDCFWYSDEWKNM